MTLKPLLSPRLAALALFFCAGLAQAQYVWITPNGTRAYSDQPPPPGTPASKILKAPRSTAPAQIDPAAEKPAEAPAEKPKAPTLAERELDYKKRGKERAEAEQKAQAAADKSAAHAAHCEELRKTKRMVESGIRIADVGPDGQQRFIDDSERAQRQASADRALRDCR